MGSARATSGCGSAPWPVADESLLERETFELVLQVNGKVRDRIEVPAGLSEDELVARAQASREGAGAPDGEERSA